MYDPPEGHVLKLGFRILAEVYSPPEGDLVALGLTTFPPYIPPPGNFIEIDFHDGGYVPPDGDSVGLEFVPDESGAPADDQYLFPVGWESSDYGTQKVWLYQQKAAPPGIVAPVVPNPAVWLYTRYLTPSGQNVSRYGTQYIWNATPQLFVSGIAAPVQGTVPKVELYDRYLRPSGVDSYASGDVFVQGGEREILPGAIPAPSVPAPKVINTKADQEAKPSGIAPIAVPQPNVSPRMLSPAGVLGTRYGVALVQHPPRALGFDASAYGIPTIEFKTRTLSVPGITLSEPFGIPSIRDRAQRVYPPSFLQVGIFGDTLIANTSAVLHVSGWQSSAFSPWATVENNRRFVTAPGIPAGGVGTQNVRNATPSLAPSGFDSLQAGDAGIGFMIRTVYAPGIASAGVGIPVLTKTPSLEPAGIVSQAFGQPTVWPYTRQILASAGDTSQYGEATVTFRYRYLAPGSAVPDRYGEPRVEHGVRGLLVPGKASQAFGTAAVANADRTVAPPSIWQNWPSAHSVGNDRAISPDGFVATRFGERIIPEIQTLYPQGFREQHGLTTIYNHRQGIWPVGAGWAQPADRWGFARVWNLRQYVRMEFDVNSDLAPPAWPRWTLIENRNRVMTTLGQNTQRFGVGAIENKARVLLPPAIPAPETGPYYKAGLVAYRIRHLPLEGMEPPYIARWTAVTNDAAVIAPSGFDGELHGDGARLVNTRRYFPYISGGDQATVEIPMVAFRVRSVSIEPRYTIEPPSIALPEVKLHTRYIDGIGTETLRPGFPSLQIHWTIVAPKWVHRDYVGDPYIRNATPEVAPYGRVTEAFGTAAVRLQWRQVWADGVLGQQFGKPIIADSTRTIAVNGLRAWAFGDKLTVVRTGAPPYATQNVSLDAVGVADGHGIPPPGDRIPNVQVPEPALNQQVLYVEQDDPATLWGTARVTANTIRVEPGLREILIGEPMVSLRNRVLVVEAWKTVLDPQKPRLSPHTIYACKEAPAQAIENHEIRNLHYVGETIQFPPGERFGHPSASLKRRALFLSGVAPPLPSSPPSSVPLIFNKRSYLTPEGIRPGRFGWHEIPGPKDVRQFASGQFAEFGNPAIKPAPYLGPQTVVPPGLAATGWGVNHIELKDRKVYPSGFQSALMGDARPGDQPFMWQGLRVGPRVPLVIGGGAMDRHGTTWISHRVREVVAGGDDFFMCEYDLTNFSGRMRVRRQQMPGIPARTVTPVGIPESAPGAANIMNHRHYIRPDGNAEQYRKGAF